MSRGTKARSGRSQLRIIGGQWRGRKLSFPEIEGLRPTADRVRETLFNWLAPDIPGANCLDLFAGSGALGLEALSRGARGCDFVEAAPEAGRAIATHLQKLSARDRGRAHLRKAQDFLENSHGPWDIVFIDPPFGHNLVAPCCALLNDSGRLNDGALVYIETPANEPAVSMAEHWELHREKRAGNVRYQLFIVRPL